jgi:hypothetical protein
VNVRVKLHKPPYTECFNQWYRTRAQRRDIRAVVVPETGGLTRLEFLSSNSEYWIDNVEFIPVEAEYVDPWTIFPIFVNPSEAPMTLFMGGRRFLSLDSIPIMGELYLPPYTSRIIVAPEAFEVTGAHAPPPPDGFGMDVYPNPSHSGSVSLRFTGVTPRGILYVYDALGRLCYFERLSPREDGTADLRIARLPAGRYFAVAVSGSDKISTRRFIVL